MRNHTKKALVLSALSLMLCVSMLVGTTFAWFTDSVTTGVNTIQSGTLDVDLVDANNNSLEGKTLNFKKAETAPAGEAILWEPGCKYELDTFKIINKGTLALKYQIVISAAQGDVKLLEAIEFTVAAGGITYNSLAAYADAMKDIPLEAGKDSGNIVITGHMKEEAGNEYQGLTVTGVAITVLATQYTHESDSFGNQYDKDATYANVVKTEADLALALRNGGLIELADDITVEKTLTVPAGVVATLDLNGKTLKGTHSKAEGAVVKNIGTMTITGGTISSTGDNGGSAIMNNGTLTVSNATLNGAPNANGGWPSYTVNNVGVLTINDSNITSIHGAVASYGADAVVTLNNTNIDMTGIPGFTNHALYTYNDGTIIVNGGNIANNATDQNATGGSVINGHVIVNGGTFSGRIENYYGIPVIKGGTFSADPTAYAKGQVVDNGNGTWTVKPYEVSDAADLASKLANGNPVVLTQDINLGKIDLTGAITNDVVIDAAGHKITTTDAYGIEVTSGKNVTISNADVEMTKEGDYITYAAGLKIANGDYAGTTITLKNCNITMANTDWAYAVNMPASVKNLNLVIDNCTLEGAIAVQCWGDNNTITITDSKLICNYTTNALYTSYCVVLQSQGSNVSENNTLVIDNCEFKYSGIDNFNSTIKGVDDFGTGNTVTVTNCTCDAKVVID